MPDFCQKCGAKVAPQDSFCPSCGASLPLSTTTPSISQQQIQDEKKGLYRSQDKWIGGVVAGVAEYYNIDIATARILFLIVCLFTGFMGGILFILYVVLWALVPEKNAQ